ncbi:hypothetical protein [Brachybacterium sacelli]|uniref:hypothetical protein n=1 Tax=Brachybacterium sacelli TaxID=173364 RepID=UPI003615D76A
MSGSMPGCRTELATPSTAIGMIMTTAPRMKTTAPWNAAFGLLAAARRWYMFWSPSSSTKAGSANPSICRALRPPSGPRSVRAREISPASDPMSTPTTKKTVTHRANTIITDERKSVQATDFSPPERARKVISTAARTAPDCSPSGVMRLMM